MAALESYRAEHETAMAGKEVEAENLMQQVEDMEKSVVRLHRLIH